MLILLFPAGLFAQEISETNTDTLYYHALDAYKAENYNDALRLSSRGLELAPEYHDIRILRVRTNWALNNLQTADEDLDLLLKNVPKYVDVKPLAEQRVKKFPAAPEALVFLNRILTVYPEDTGLKVQKALLLLQDGQRKEARELALELVSKNDISGGQRYSLQNVLNRTISDEMGINYQYINFSEAYSRSDSWNLLSLEYQHNFDRTAVIGRINYTNRGYDEGKLYELEVYPVFSDRFYGFVNAGFSNDMIFPDFRGSASLYYNFASNFEAEVGSRMLFYNNSSYFSGIIGLTAYSGKFYLNLRSFLGPKRMEQLVQNYQFNLRFYLKNADNYLFLRLGSGISPDETSLYSRVQTDPTLDAYYGNLGINKSFGVHHIFNLGAGFLYEDITSAREGTQFVGFAGYRYRF
ncbi:MAG: YaiO family outer membrane beta-barrel protein [Salinimicrobium sp.]